MKRPSIKPILRYLTISACAGFFLNTPAFSADDYNQWASSATITLNTSSSGANIAGTVTNFPVLIRLNPGNFVGFVNTNAGGSDIRFAKPNGTHLPYQIERWVDSTNNKDSAEIWVKLDTVYGNNSTQSIKIFWGKSTAVDSSSGPAVFDSANGFNGVWHMKEALGNISDATSKGNTGVNMGTTSIAGIVGYGRLFNKSYINLGTSPSLCGLTNAISVSAWLKTSQKDTNVSVIRNNQHFTAMQFDSTHAWTTMWNAGTPKGIGYGTFSDGQWHHFTFQFRAGTGCAIYKDGVQVAKDSTDTAGLSATNGAFYLGATESANENYNGILDEVRVEKAFHSVDWIKLCYQNQQTNQTFFSIVVPVTSVTYKYNPVSYITGSTVMPDTAVVAGKVDSFSVSPNLPSGLSISKTTGIISGVPSTATPTTSYTVTAKNGATPIPVSLSITIYSAVKASIWSRDSSGAMPLTISFVDTSTGDYSKRKWIFGDGAVDSVTKNPSHTYTSAGTYFVKLAVWGNGGVDTARKTILAWTTGSNPLQMDAQYLYTKPAGDSQKVALLVRNINSIISPTNSVPPLTADSIGIWYQTGKIPTSPDSSLFLKKYLLSTLKSKGDQYPDTLMVPAIPAGQNYYGFMTTIYWSDKKMTLFSNGNGSLVLMRDTVTPPNTIVLSGKYLPNDTAMVYVDSVLSIDTNKVDSLFITYNITKDSVDFGNNLTTQGFSIHDVAKAAKNNRFQYPFINHQAFYNGKKTIYFAARVMGINDKASGVKKCQIIVGQDRPTNPVVLKATPLSPNRIQLTWNNLSSYGFNRIIILYQTQQPFDTTSDMSLLMLDTLVPAFPSDTFVVGTTFHESTKYYFGAQVYKNNLWSSITTNSSATATTPASVIGKLDSNTIHLVKPTIFDTTKNTIKVKWTVNRVVSDNLEIGISYSLKSMPTQDTSIGVKNIIPVKGNTDSAIVTLNEALSFNSTYYIALWLHKPDGKWTDPTQASSDSVVVPAATWQSVVYFTKYTDTVFAFNQNIRLMNKPGNVSNSVNILTFFSPPQQAIQGFSQVSGGVEFSNKDLGDPFYIGLKVGSVPAGYAFSDIRIYRDSAGYMELLRAPILFDSVNKYVSIFTNNLDYPFVAMVDKTAPTHNTLTQTSLPVPAETAILNTVVVHDNISNCVWKFMYARGNEAYDTINHMTRGSLHDTCETLGVTIDPSFVTQDNGVRAIMVIDNGVRTDTVVFSRRVFRGSDIAFSEPLEWVPLSVTADLDTSDMKTVLRGFSPDGTAWKYDNKKFRIFRCLPGQGQGNEFKWVEYADSIADIFSFTRGKVLWVKADAKYTVQFGNSITPSLDSVFTFQIPPKSWVDFSLPFKFDITVGDILDATGNASTALGTLLFDVWQQDAATKEYISKMVFMQSSPGTGFNSITTQLSMNSVYTLYNSASDTINLKVPPLPAVMSKQGLQKASSFSHSPGWVINVASKEENGAPIGPVYCACSNDENSGAKSYFPQAPSFCTSHVGVFDNTTNKMYGLAIAHANKDSGTAYMISFINDGNSAKRILYHLDNVASVPKDQKAVVYNAETGSFDDFSKSDAAISLDAGAKGYRWLFVGNAAYLSKARQIARPTILSLVGAYPNPFKGRLKIRYSLPYDGIKSVKFMLFGMSGKVVWRHEVKDALRSGVNDLYWNGKTENGQPIAAGVYILSMTALNTTLKQSAVFEKKLTYLP